jgi:hypothetical protein
MSNAKFLCPSTKTILFAFILTLLAIDSGCSKASAPPQPPPPAPSPLSSKGAPMSPLTSEPPRRTDQTAIDLQKILSKWARLKETTYLETGMILSTTWSLKHGTDPQYFPDGVDDLIERLKKWPAFKTKQHVQNLGLGSFNPDTGIRTAGDLWEFVELNQTPQGT